MSLLKYVKRLKRMDDLIRRKATGTPEQFAKRLGLGKSILMEELNELRMLGAKIVYCRERQSYYYENSFVFKIGEIDHNGQNVILGGRNCLELHQSGITGMSEIILDVQYL